MVRSRLRSPAKTGTNSAIEIHRIEPFPVDYSCGERFLGNAETDEISYIVYDYILLLCIDTIEV